MSIETKSRDFQDIREEYNRLFQTEPVRDEDRGYRWLASQALQDLNHPKRFLDLACGGGYFLRELNHLTQQQLDLFGTDLSDSALDLAKIECPRARFERVPAESRPFSDGFFDAITCLGSLEHFLDIEKAIHEMTRVTKPEGKIFILVPNMFWYKDIWSVFWKGARVTRNQTQERFASMGEWRELFEKCGLNVHTIKKYNGIAKSPAKQQLKDLIIPLHFSYHFLFIASPKKSHG